MVAALLLTGTLLLGLLGIGGLVLVRFLAGPMEVAMPPPIDTPTSVPGMLATPTSAALPTSTPVAMPTATLVVSPTTATPVVGGLESGPAEDGPGMSSPVSESSEMPESGLGPLETVGIGLVLISCLGGARMVRRMRTDGQA
jgi:hypothetical protein